MYEDRHGFSRLFGVAISEEQAPAAVATAAAAAAVAPAATAAVTGRRERAGGRVESVQPRTRRFFPLHCDGSEGAGSTVRLCLAIPPAVAPAAAADADIATRQRREERGAPRRRPPHATSSDDPPWGWKVQVIGCMGCHRGSGGGNGWSGGGSEGRDSRPPSDNAIKRVGRTPHHSHRRRRRAHSRRALSLCWFPCGHSGGRRRKYAAHRTLPAM